MQPATPHPPDRRADQALGLLIGVLLVVMIVRGYGGQVGMRPTDHRRPVIITAADLNRADRTELLQVPGIGPQLADAILAHRSTATFAHIDDLRLVKGIGPATLDKLRPWLSVEPSADPELRVVETLARKLPTPTSRNVSKLRPGDPPLDVNTASEVDLQRLPGVGPTLAARIVVVRGTERFKSPDDLRRVKGIGVKTLENLRALVVCR